MQDKGSSATTIDDTIKPISALMVVSPNGELDLFVLALLIRKNGRRITLSAIVGFFLTLLVMLITTPRYSATAVLIVPQSSPSAASLALKLATGGMAGGGGNTDVYQDILESRSIADRLIDQYHLKSVYKTKDIVAAEKTLASMTKITTSKEGLIKVVVQDVDPIRSAALANSYLAELDHMNDVLSITSAGQQRLYFEREMVKEKNALADAEVELAKTQESTGIVAPVGQVTAEIEAIEQARAQLRLSQIQLQALLQGATAENPDVIRLQAQIKGQEQQLQAMENGPGASVAIGIPTAKTPERALEYIRKERDVKFHEAVFGLLAKQWEVAKQEEAKTVSMIEVLDRAVVPEHKSWPPRTLFCILGLLGGALLGVVWTLTEPYLRTVMANSDNRKRYESIMSTNAQPQHHQASH